MKKLFAVILIFATLLGLCACDGSGEGDNGSTTEPKAQGLQIGYARESIMPNGQVNISGGANAEHRVSSGFLDILYATCIAVSENGSTLLLFSTDTLSAKTLWTEEARKLINEATGVPEENIHIGGTHTHSGPAIGQDNLPLVAQYKPIFMDALVKSAKDAIADQAPAALYGAKVQTEKMNFIRHYLMVDGSYAGSNFGDFNKEIVDYAAKNDPEMVLVKAEREGKKDILMMNFQAHPCFGGDSSVYNSLSADYIGTTRTAVEAATDVQFVFFLGATGNHNTSSKIPADQSYINSDVKTYGEALAKYAIDALPNMTPIQGSGVKTTQKKLEYKSNDYGQDRLEQAKLPYEMYKQNGDSKSATAYAKSLGFQSVFECNGIVACSKYPETGTMELNACSFGGVGFVAAPYEMFAANGMHIKENSPFEFTLISTVTNQGNGYYPTKEAYGYGCYESYTARFASGVAEDVADEFVQMLKDVQ